MGCCPLKDLAFAEPWDAASPQQVLPKSITVYYNGWRVFIPLRRPRGRGFRGIGGQSRCHKPATTRPAASTYIYKRAFSVTRQASRLCSVTYTDPRRGAPRGECCAKRCGLLARGPPIGAVGSCRDNRRGALCPDGCILIFEAPEVSAAEAPPGAAARSAPTSSSADIARPRLLVFRWRGGCTRRFGRGRDGECCDD